MTRSRVVSPLFLPLLLLSLVSLARADSTDDWKALRSCRNCVVPRIYSPRWMGVDVVKYTARPCRWIECEGNLELWVNGKNFGMKKLECDNGQFRSMQHLDKNTVEDPEKQEKFKKGMAQRESVIREVMCVIPAKQGYYDDNGKWTEKINARCGVKKIHFDIGCHRNEYFSPFDNCAAVNEDSIQCPPGGYQMHVLLKTMPMALHATKLQCEGEEWKVHKADGTILPRNVHKADGTILPRNVTEQDSTVVVRCHMYIKPLGDNFTVEFVWFGALTLIVFVGVYRCLNVHGVQDIFAFLRKPKEEIEEEREAKKRAKAEAEAAKEKSEKASKKKGE